MQAKKRDKPTAQFNFTIDKDLMNSFRKHCIDLGVTPTHALEFALRRYLSSTEQATPAPTLRTALSQLQNLKETYEKKQ